MTREQCAPKDNTETFSEPDIVERLRQNTSADRGFYRSDVERREAADEIERLAATVDACADFGDKQRTEIERLKAQNAKLRRWRAMDKPLTAAMNIVATDMQQLRAEVERLLATLNYVADMTYCGTDAEWHFKPGYDPQIVLDALEHKP